MASAMRGSATLCAGLPAIACGYTTICETSVLVVDIGKGFPKFRELLPIAGVLPPSG